MKEECIPRNIRKKDFYFMQNFQIGYGGHIHGLRYYRSLDKLVYFKARKIKFWSKMKDKFAGN